MTLRKLYETDPDVQRLADSLHDTEKGCGPTCESCISKAARRLGSLDRLEEDFCEPAPSIADLAERDSRRLRTLIVQKGLAV